jgi:hypothetical protein
MKARAIAVALVVAGAQAGAQPKTTNPFDDLIPKSDVPPCKNGKVECEPWERDWEKLPSEKRWWENDKLVTPLPDTRRMSEPTGDQPWERYVRRLAAEGKERYALLSFTRTGSAWFLEVAGLVEAWDNSRRFKTVWIKVDHSQDRTIKHRTTMQRVTVNCQDDSFSRSAYAEYAADGTNLRSASGPAFTYEAIFPDSLMEVVEKALCKGGKSANLAQ